MSTLGCWEASSVNYAPEVLAECVVGKAAGGNTEIEHRLTIFLAEGVGGIVYLGSDLDHHIIESLLFLQVCGVGGKLSILEECVCLF